MLQDDVDLVLDADAVITAYVVLARTASETEREEEGHVWSSDTPPQVRKLQTRACTPAR